jgi:hypothetical protein
MTDHHGPQRTDKVRVNPEKRKRRPSGRFPKANSLGHCGPPRATAAQVADNVRVNISLIQQKRSPRSTKIDQDPRKSKHGTFGLPLALSRSRRISTYICLSPRHYFEASRSVDRCIFMGGPSWPSEGQTHDWFVQRGPMRPPLVQAVLGPDQ